MQSADTRFHCGQGLAPFHPPFPAWALNIGSHQMVLVFNQEKKKKGLFSCLLLLSTISGFFGLVWFF